MKLTPKIALLLASAFVLPAVGMGLAGARALTEIEEDAGRAAIDATVEMEKARLEQLVVRRAHGLDSLLARVELDVQHLQQSFEDGYSPTLPVVREDRLYDTPGWPGYGRIDPVNGAYADFDRKGRGSPWLPRWAVARGRADPAERTRISALLRRAVALTPALERLRGRYPGLLDLAWVVTTAGPTNAWPPYDYRVVIHENPGIVDLDESSQDYVRLVSPDENPTRVARWIDPYRDMFKARWMTSVVAPLYDGDTFQGSVGADLLLSSLIEEALTAPAGEGSYAALLGPSRAPLATTRQGVEELVEDPDLRAALLAAMSGTAAPAWSPELLERLRQGSLERAQDPALRELGQACRSSGGQLELTIAGTRRLVACAPMPTPGWVLVGVVPVEALAASTAGVRDALTEGRQAVEREYILYTLTILLMTTAAGVLVHRIAVRPITALAARVEALSPDQLVLPPTPDRDDEIGTLQRRIGELLRLVRSNGERLREKRERLAATLRGITDAVVSTDDRGWIHLANPVAETFAGRALAGTAFVEALPLFAEASGKAAGDVVAQVLAADGPITLDERLELRVPGLAPRAVSVSGSAVRGGDGGVTGAVLVLRDVSAARRMEEGLARIQKLETVQVLAAGIAHDFNNLLAGIAGWISLAGTLVPPGSPALEKLEKAERAIGRGRGLTAQLLTFSRGGDPVRTHVALGPLLTEAANFALRGMGGRCDWGLADDLWPVHADPAQLGQVVQNLIINALQAMPGEGRLEIRARNVRAAPGPLPEGRYVEVAVRDHGVGIPAENLTRIFDPFFTTKARGTGLGLAVCFSILQKHGGHIEAESAPGAGTTFRFWLPASDADSPLPEPKPLAGGRRVLVLDDDPTARMVLTEMVRALDLDVLAVGTSDDAVRAAREQAFDLFLFDLTLPGGPGGVETLARIRAHGITTPAIVASGYSDDAALAEPARFGFVGALRKPFDLPTLRAELRRVLS